MTTLKIVAWNANGLTPNLQEVEQLLNIHKLDILLDPLTARFTTTRLKKSLYTLNLKTLSTAETTHWPYNTNRVPDV